MRGKPVKHFQTTEQVPLRIPLAALQENPSERILSVATSTELPLQSASQVPPRGRRPNAALENGNILYNPDTRVQWPLSPTPFYLDTITYRVVKGNGEIEERRATVTVQRPGSTASQAASPTGTSTLAPAVAAPLAVAGTNPISAENALPGNPESEWGISGTGSSNIEGFATDISVNKGSTVHFKVNTNARAYHIDLYRVGYYGGMG